MDKMRKRSTSKDPAKDSLLSNDHLSSASGNDTGPVNTALATTDNKGVKGLTTAEVEALYEQWGYNELPSIVIPLWYIFLTQFTGTMPYM